jgi:hypothetical protein
MCPVFAFVDSSFASGTKVRLDVSMLSLFATLTDGLVLVCSTEVQYGVAALSR